MNDSAKRLEVILAEVCQLADQVLVSSRGLKENAADPQRRPALEANGQVFASWGRALGKAARKVEQVDKMIAKTL
ncbi:MAG: hypothetical protein EOP38_31810, partial [Rubrivivax sp.]